MTRTSERVDAGAERADVVPHAPSTASAIVHAIETAAAAAATLEGAALGASEGGVDAGAQSETASATVSDIRVAVSTVIFTLRRPREDEEHHVIRIPLVRRTRDPYEGRWALPGGWLRERENLAHAASRTLEETTGLAPSYLEQLYAFGDVDRSPTRVVSIVYWALVRSDEAKNANAQENVEWFDADDLPALAFDHAEIIDYALWRLRNKVGYSRIAHGFLPERFTLAELRETHEAVLGRALDPANFRRQVEGSGAILATKDFKTGNHRPARLYETDTQRELAERGPLRDAAR